MNRNECAQASDDLHHASNAWPTELLLSNPVSPGTRSISPEFPLKDYLNARRDLAYEAMHFPLGFPVRILSNSPRVMEAAKQSWNSFAPAFHGEALEFLLDVRMGKGSNDALPPEPAHMVEGSLLMQVADVDNFYIADMNRGRAMGRVTPATAECSRYLRYHILESAVLSLIATTRAVAVHGACLRVGGQGVLLCADSGEGKSTLAYAGARAGWTYISDDGSYVPMYRDDRLAIGNCHQMRFRPSGVELFPELAGHPITPRAVGKPSIEVRTSEWPGIATDHASRIDYVVFLNRRYADTQELIPLRSSAVWPWFAQHLISPPKTRPAQEATLARLLTAGLFELRYSDLGWAIERINQLAQKGH
jgi:hypothetical protein